MAQHHRVSTLRTLGRALLCMAALGLGGCASTPLLEVRFDGDVPGAPPSTTQALGTVAIDPGAGSVLVVAAVAVKVAKAAASRTSAT